MIVSLTDTHIACGVTEDQVRANLSNVYVCMERTLIVVMMDNVGPALAGALAINAFGAPVEYSGLNHMGHMVYRPIN